MQEQKRIHFALDIDQTLAGGVVPSHMIHYNDRLDLGMTPEEIAATSQFAKTFDVPQIISYRSKDEDGFQAARSEVRTSNQVHLDFASLPGSVEGARSLLEHATVSYYSVRPAEVHGATIEWLEKKGYPNPNEVTICDSPEDKLRKIAADHLQNPDNTIVLIDDSFKQLTDAAALIVEADPLMREQFERLILVGYGVDHDGVQLEETFYIKSGLRTIALPAWEQGHLAQMIANIKPTN